jgi:hypothetical protein
MELSKLTSLYQIGRGLLGVKIDGALATVSEAMNDEKFPAGGSCSITVQVKIKKPEFDSNWMDIDANVKVVTPTRKILERAFLDQSDGFKIDTVSGDAQQPAFDFNADDGNEPASMTVTFPKKKEVING